MSRKERRPDGAPFTRERCAGQKSTARNEPIISPTPEIGAPFRETLFFSFSSAGITISSDVQYFAPSRSASIAKRQKSPPNLIRSRSAAPRKDRPRAK